MSSVTFCLSFFSFFFFFFGGKHMQILTLSRSSCPKYVYIYKCVCLFTPCPALRKTGGSLPQQLTSMLCFSKLRNKTGSKNDLFRRRGNGTTGRTSFLGQSRKAATERIFSIIKSPKLVTKRNRADVEDFGLAEEFGTTSQGTEFPKYLRKSSVTCNKNLAAGATDKEGPC